MWREFQMARHAMLVSPLRQYRNFVEDVGVFGEHSVSRLRWMIATNADRNGSAGFYSEFALRKLRARPRVDGTQVAPWD